MLTPQGRGTPFLKEKLVHFFSKNMRWALIIIAAVGTGLLIGVGVLNRSQTIGSGVTGEDDPLAQMGRSWNREEIVQVHGRGKSLFALEKQVSHSLYLDEKSDVDSMLTGSVRQAEGRTLKKSEASVLYPANGTPWGEKGPCLVWRFQGVDLDGNNDFGGLEVHLEDRRSEEQRFHIAFLSRIATVPLVPGQRMKYIVVPDMAVRPNNTRALDKSHSLDVVFPGITSRDEVDLLSVTLLSKCAGYSDAAWGYAYETLDQETRSVMYQWTDGVIGWNCVLAGNHPTLKFGTGILPGTAPVTFSILVETGGTQREVFRKRVEETDVWSDHTIDLSALRGYPVKVIFRAHGGSSSVALWSSPRIVEAGRRGKLFCIYLVDALRADFCEGFSTFRGRANATPAILTLAGQGARFTSAFANAPVTKYSVATLFTGLIPSHNGIMKYQRLPDDIETLAEVFRENGFMTASFLFNENAGSMRGFQQGFNVLFTTERVSREARLLEQSKNRDIYAAKPELTSAGMINDFLFSFIEGHGEEDLFLYLHLMDTHAPYFPDQEYLTEFYERMFQLGEDVPADLTTLLTELTHTQRPNYSPKDHLCEEALLELYRGAVKTADKHLGRFMDFLRSQDRDGDATVIFTSDHGEHLDEHPGVRLFTHMHPMLLEVLRIPLIIYSPKLIPGGTVISKPVQLADLMPTLLDLAGITYTPYHYDGLSLLLLLGGEDDELFNKRPIVSQSSPFWSVLLGDVHCPDITRRYDLTVYNIVRDPREHKPLVGEIGRKALSGLLDSLAVVARREVPGTESITSHEQTLRQLKELGYIQ